MFVPDKSYGIKDPQFIKKGLSKPAMRRLARRAGSKRVSATIYEPSRIAMQEFLYDVTIFLERKRSIKARCLRSTSTVEITKSIDSNSVFSGKS